MDADGRSSANRTYDELHPQSEWVRESGSNTLIIDLPGFKKEHLRVQLDNMGNLKIGGERPPVSDNRWTRFRKDFRIPENSNLNDIRAKFEKGTLYVIIPTTIAQTRDPPQQSPPPPPPPAPQKAPSTQKDETEKKTKEDVPEQKPKLQPSPETAGTAVTSTRKEEKGSPAGAETPLGSVSCEPARTGAARTFVTKMKRPNQLVVNMLVSFAVVVGIGIYAAYKFKAATEKRNQD